MKVKYYRFCTAATMTVGGVLVVAAFITMGAAALEIVGGRGSPAMSTAGVSLLFAVIGFAVLRIGLELKWDVTASRER